MLEYQLGGEAWPSSKISVIDNLNEGIFSWAYSRGMKLGG